MPALNSGYSNLGTSPAKKQTGAEGRKSGTQLLLQSAGGLRGRSAPPEGLHLAPSSQEEYNDKVFRERIYS